MKTKKAKGIIVRSDEESLKIIVELAKKMGADVFSLTDRQLVDFALGEHLNKARKSKKVNRDVIMKELDNSIPRLE